MRHVGEEVMAVFHSKPEALPIYLEVEQWLEQAFPDAVKKVSRTQVGFSGRYGFAYVWPPARKIKGRPGVYVVLTFGLGRRVQDPRIVESVEPYPGRWTHHVLVGGREDLDPQLMGWVREAYDFSNNKGRKKT